MSPALCPECGSVLTRIRGTRLHRPRSWYRCSQCSVSWTYRMERIYGQTINRGYLVRCQAPMPEHCPTEEKR